MAIRINEYGHIVRDDSPNQPTNNSSIQNNIVQPSNPGPDQLYVRDGSNQLSYLREGSVPTTTNGSGTRLERSVPWYGKSGVFWTITMLFAGAVGAGMSLYVAPLVFGTSGGGDTVEEIVNALCGVAPIIVFVGAFIGACIYNVKYTRREKDHYSGGEYILSLFSAVGGTLAVGVMMFVAVLAIYAIALIIAAVIAIAVLAGIFGG